MQAKFERAFLAVAGLIYEATWRAWIKMARRSTVGEIVAKWREAEARCARLEAERDLLRERLAKIDPSCRPHFSRHGRFEVLLHMRRWGLTIREAAEVFLVTPETIARWRRLVEAGKSALVAPQRALNRLSDLTRELVQRLKIEQAPWGTRRIRDILVRLGLRLGRTSVQRILREPRPPRRRAPPPAGGGGRGPVVAAYPMHVAMIDFTSVRLPLIRQIWIGAVVDVFSRRILAIRAWGRVPLAADARSLLDEAIRRWGKMRYLITDRGTQFTARTFKRLLSGHGMLRRYGAVAKFQSVAIIDRPFGGIKREYAGRWMLLLPIRLINEGLQRYAQWHSQSRPHQGLGGRTPAEIFDRRRRRCPDGRRLVDLRLVHHRGDARLPVYRRVLAA